MMCACNDAKINVRSACTQGATTTITEADTSSLTYCYAIGFGARLPEDFLAELACAQGSWGG